MNTINRYTNSSRSDLLRHTAIILASAALITLPAATLADTPVAVDNADYAIEKQVSASEAKRLARSHLNALGFSTHVGPGPGAARIRSVTRDAGTWIIYVRVTNGGAVFSKQHVLYVNAQTGVVSEVPPRSSPAQVVAE